jgi:hypothetical protein
MDPFHFNGRRIAFQAARAHTQFSFRKNIFTAKQIAGPGWNGQENKQAQVILLVFIF